MRIRIIRCLLVILMSGLVAACASGNTAGSPPAGETPETERIDEQALIAMGEPVYSQHCARCHDSQGAGFPGTYPPLAGSDAVAGDPEPIVDVIVHGRRGMPAFGDELSDQEIAAVTSFIRSAWGNDASPVWPEDVQEAR